MAQRKKIKRLFFTMLGGFITTIGKNAPVFIGASFTSLSRYRARVSEVQNFGNECSSRRIKASMCRAIIAFIRVMRAFRRISAECR